MDRVAREALVGSEAWVEKVQMEGSLQAPSAQSLGGEEVMEEMGVTAAEVVVAAEASLQECISLAHSPAPWLRFTVQATTLLPLAERA